MYLRVYARDRQVNDASDSHRPTVDAVEIVLIFIINESIGEYTARSGQTRPDRTKLARK